MIKINWSDVDNFQSLMQRQGIPDAQEFSIIILYNGKRDSERHQVKLSSIQNALFDISDNKQVRGVYVYDLECKRVFLRFLSTNQVNTLETAPASGHPQVLLGFGDMTPEGRDVWLDITEAALQQYLMTEA